MKVTVQLPERCGAQALLDGPHHRQLSGALGRRLGRRLRDEPRKADQLQPSAEVPRPTQVGGRIQDTWRRDHAKGAGKMGPGHPPCRQEAVQPLVRCRGRFPSPGTRPRCLEGRAETSVSLP